MIRFNSLKPHWLYVMLLMGLMLVPQVVQAVESQSKYYLVLWEKDGTKVGEYSLEYHPKVTFSGTEVIVSNDLADVYYYNLSDMWKFTYFKDDGSGINSIFTDGNVLKFDGNAIVFPSLEAGSRIAVYAVNGVLLMNKTVSTAGEYAFPLSGLNQGVYLVNVNGKTYKIVKK